jgi:signal peptidase II
LTIRYKTKYLVLIGSIIFLDQATKFIITSSLNLYDRIEVIKGFFQVIYVRNSGAIWGILSDHPNAWVQKVITILSVAALVIVIYYFLKLPSRCLSELISLSFIMGGAVGNIIDRLFQGYVVDFLDFYIKDLHWPTFNAADSFISIGVVILIFSIWRGKCTSI